MKIKERVKHSNKSDVISIECNPIIEDNSSDDSKIPVSKKSSEHCKEARFYLIIGIALFTCTLFFLIMWILFNNYGKYYYSFTFIHPEIL